MQSHYVSTHTACCVSRGGFRDDYTFDEFATDGCLDAPRQIPSGSARLDDSGCGFTFDTGYCGSREHAGFCFSVSPDIGDVVDGSAAVSQALPSQGVNKSGFLDGVSDRPLEQVVGDIQPDHCDDRAGQDRDKDLFAVCGGQCDLHGSSSGCVQPDAKRFCSPPPVNAAGQLDGSPKAGEGVGTPTNCAKSADGKRDVRRPLMKESMARAVEAFRLFEEYRDAGMRASADRQRARCMAALWSYMESDAALRRKSAAIARAL